MQNLRSPIKIHGGKSYLKSWIVSNLPEDYQSLTYCELCCGGCSVLLNKHPSINEIINDIDKGIVSIFKALRDEPQEYIGRLKELNYNESTFKLAIEKSKNKFEDYIEMAVNEYVLRRMSRGGMKKAFAWSDRQRGGKPGDVNAWNTMLSQLPIIADRLKNVSVLHGDFLTIAKVWDDKDVIMYFDPPYLPETRSKGASEVYDHEMSLDDHLNLLNFAKNARSKIMISGYLSPIYNKHLKEWRSAKKNVANHSGQNDNKQRRIEVIWMNY